MLEGARFETFILGAKMESFEKLLVKWVNSLDWSGIWEFDWKWEEERLEKVEIGGLFWFRFGIEKLELEKRFSELETSFGMEFEFWREDEKSFSK